MLNDSLVSINPNCPVPSPRACSVGRQTVTLKCHHRICLLDALPTAYRDTTITTILVISSAAIPWHEHGALSSGYPHIPRIIYDGFSYESV